MRTIKAWGEWRNDKPTDKQLELIKEMQKLNNIPVFEGTTKGDACDYIRRYGKR